MTVAVLTAAPGALGDITVTYAPSAGGGLAVSSLDTDADGARVSLLCNAPQGCVFRVVDPNTVVATAGTGCVLTGVAPATIDCEVGGGPRTVRARLGAEDDTLVLARCDAPVRLVADLGPGDDRFTGCTTGTGGAASADTVFGGTGDDVLDGRDGRDRLNGGAGRDRVLGGGDADVLVARDGEADRVACGTEPSQAPGPGGATPMDTGTPADLAVLDTRDGLPVDCERIDAAAPGRRTGTVVHAPGLIREVRGRVNVDLTCRLPRCTGRVAAQVVTRGLPVPTRPTALASTFGLQRGLRLRAPIALSRPDVRVLDRLGIRTAALRVTVFEPAGRGWSISVRTVPGAG